MLKRLLALSVVLLTSFVEPTTALAGRGHQRDPVERRSSDDGADLTAVDSVPGGSGDGTDGCGLWGLLSVLDVPGVPAEMLVGLDPDSGRIRRTTGQGIAQSLYIRTCADRVPAIEYGWFDDSPGLGDLLLEARGQLIIPVPAPEFSPPAATVRTFVGIDTWFWVPSVGWAPEVESVSAGGVTVTATATPLVLRFRAGDGSPPMECPGPGTPWEDGATTTCSYTYQWVSAHHESGSWPAVIEVDWEVTWTSNVGQAGVLEPFTMSTAVPMRVAEAQAVLRLPGN